jgi:hypothetical protein
MQKQPKNDLNAPEVSDAEQSRREFLSTFGKLAAVSPVALSVLISPRTSAAPKSCRGNGTKKCT